MYITIRPYRYTYGRARYSHNSGGWIAASVPVTVHSLGGIIPSRYRVLGQFSRCYITERLLACSEDCVLSGMFSVL